MKIGILYICTGRYDVFWKGFHDSCERFFITEAEKHYFVFTDSVDITCSDHVTVFPEEPKGFPMDSLLRFEMFDRIKPLVAGCDYVFFFNSNMLFVHSVTASQFLPDAEQEGLVALLHPGYYDKGAMLLPYERRRQSTAYIPYQKEEVYQYFMGSLNGGSFEAYYQLIGTCKANIQKDMEQHVMAVYHDESHLNCYLHGKSVKALSPAFGLPEDSDLPFEPYIVILNKMKHGGTYFDKLPQKAWLRRTLLFIKRTYRSILWRWKI